MANHFQLDLGPHFYPHITSNIIITLSVSPGTNSLISSLGLDAELSALDGDSSLVMADVTINGLIECMFSMYPSLAFKIRTKIVK